MQFNVAQLLQEPIGSTRTYDMVEDITELEPDMEVLGPLVGKVELLRTHSGVLVTGELSTAIRVMCNLCLAPIASEVRFQLEESFHPLTEVQTGRFIRPEEFEGSTTELEDEALLIDDHHILDISEVVRQDIWLAIPIAPGCNWEGAGQCPNLTQHLSELEGLERGPSDPEPEAENIDPRWAALLDLEAKLDEVE